MSRFPIWIIIYHRFKSCDRVVTLWFFIKKGLTVFSCKPLFLFGTPGGIRTPGLRIRSPALYPAELRAREAGKMG
jgi:hypothetical protein